MCFIDQDIRADAFTHLLHLDILVLEGVEVARDSKVVHMGLRSLTLTGYFECSSLSLECPLLEYLEIKSMEFLENWDEDFACPKLRKVHLVWDNRGSDDEFVMRSKTVEELILQGLNYELVFISCPKMGQLSISWNPLGSEAPSR